VTMSVAHPGATFQSKNQASLVFPAIMKNHAPEASLRSDRHGGLYQLRIFPYRTPENKIDCAVITIVNISPQSLSETA